VPQPVVVGTEIALQCTGYKSGVAKGVGMIVCARSGGALRRFNHGLLVCPQTDRVQALHPVHSPISTGMLAKEQEHPFRDGMTDRSSSPSQG